MMRNRKPILTTISAPLVILTCIFREAEGFFLIYLRCMAIGAVLMILWNDWVRYIENAERKPQ